MHWPPEQPRWPQLVMRLTFPVPAEVVNLSTVPVAPGTLRKVGVRLEPLVGLWPREASFSLGNGLGGQEGPPFKHGIVCCNAVNAACFTGESPWEHAWFPRIYNVVFLVKTAKSGVSNEFWRKRKVLLSRQRHFRVTFNYFASQNIAIFKWFMNEIRLKSVSLIWRCQNAFAIYRKHTSLEATSSRVLLRGPGLHRSRSSQSSIFSLAPSQLKLELELCSFRR